MSILRNSAWNALGIVVPSLAAIPALAIYSRLLGVELLGLLTLSFAIVGYASSFDLGLSRALIRQVSVHHCDIGMVKVFMGTTTLFVAAVSLLLALLTAAAAPWLAHYLGVSPEHRDDAVASFYWVALSVPPYLLTLAGTAYFEGIEDFRSVNILRCLSGALNAAAGVAAVLWTPQLAAVLAALSLSRWLTCIGVYGLYVHQVNRRDPTPRPALWVFKGAALRSSLAYGGWLTLSNVVGPVMMYFDRFVLSHLAGARVVAFYTVPSEVVSRLAMFPAAISRALFPRLSKQHADAAADRRTGLRLTLISSALTILPAFVFAGDILGLWMGAEYQGTPATVLRILLVGFFFNALAFGPFTDLQARGHSKATACVHMIEVVPYIASLIWLTHAYGIVGTALAWSGRTLIDYLIMEGCSHRFVGTRHFGTTLNTSP